MLEDKMREVREQLHAKWQIEANALNRSWFPDKSKFNTAVAKLNAKYQMQEHEAFTQLQQQEKERQRVQELIAKPDERSRAEEADIRLELEPEAERLVFPPQQDPGSLHQQNVAEQNRVLDIVEPFVKDNGKLYQAKIDEKGYYTDKPNKSKPATPEEIQMWATAKNALAILEQEEQDILGQLSGTPDPAYLQSLLTNKRREGLLKRIVKGYFRITAPGLMYKSYKKLKSEFGAEPNGTFAQKVQQTVAKPQRQQVQNKPSRQELLVEYNRLGGSQTSEGREFADRNLR